MKSQLLDSYRIEVICKEVVILGLRLKEKSCNYTVIIYCVYLPPENSVWGRNSNLLFSTLTSEMYLNCDSDTLIICGDFNSRVGHEKNYVDGIDNITHYIAFTQPYA